MHSLHSAVKGGRRTLYRAMAARSGIRQLGFGMAAAAITFAVGTLLGTAVA